MWLFRGLRSIFAVLCGCRTAENRGLNRISGKVVLLRGAFDVCREWAGVGPMRRLFWMAIFSERQLLRSVSHAEQPVHSVLGRGFGLARGYGKRRCATFKAGIPIPVVHSAADGMSVDKVIRISPYCWSTDNVCSVSSNFWREPVSNLCYLPYSAHCVNVYYLDVHHFGNTFKYLFDDTYNWPIICFISKWPFLYLHTTVVVSFCTLFDLSLDFTNPFQYLNSKPVMAQIELFSYSSMYR